MKLIRLTVMKVYYQNVYFFKLFCIVSYYAINYINVIFKINFIKPSALYSMVFKFNVFVIKSNLHLIRLKYT